MDRDRCQSRSMVVPNKLITSRGRDVRYKSLAKQLSAVFLAAALTAPATGQVMAKSFIDDEESVNIISPSDLGTNLPGGPTGVSAPVAPQRTIPKTST